MVKDVMVVVGFLKRTGVEMLSEDDKEVEKDEEGE